ncbi:MAG: glycosyltransferase [Parcubacteria group bacterium Gr01-1014_38]|nr:MAG: glycosyltransferase [Parcubacteria group bacterium Gr01-1014_38]
MKLLLITNEFPPIGGGGASLLQYAVRYLTEEHGHEVCVVTSSYRDLPRHEQVGRARIIRVPAVRRYKDFCATWELVTYGLSALLYCLWFVPRTKPDLIHAYFALPGGFVARILHLLYGTPYVLYFGGSDMPGANPTRYKNVYPFIRGLTRWVWRSASVSTVCSEGLLKLGRTLDPQYDFRLVPNGVELVQFVPVERPPNPVVKVLFIGRLIPRKGFQYVVRALPRVRELTSVPFEIEVVGSGAMRAYLDDLATKLRVSHLIKYQGTVPYSELHHSYQGADIFVLTSESEGMPCATLEAMACGLPIVTTDVPGNQEIVREGENGFLIPVGDTERLAQTLAWLIRDPALRRRLGAQSRRIVQPYDWHDIVRRYEAIFREVLQRAQSGLRTAP